MTQAIKKWVMKSQLSPGVRDDLGGNSEGTGVSRYSR